MATRSNGPLVFFDFTYHYGGSFQSTVLLIRELRRITEVVVIDAFGDTPSYIEDLLALGVKMVVLCPRWRGKTTIGGINPVTRCLSLFAYLPILIWIIIRLRQRVSDIKPRAIWVNSEKALFTVWLAVPNRIPLIFYVRTELKRIRKTCYFAWKKTRIILGVSEKSLKYLRSTPFAHSKCKVIYNGIDVDQTLLEAEQIPANRLGFEPQGMCIVIPASMGSSLKGQEFGILALAEFLQRRRGATLYLCGEVPPGASFDYYRKLQKMVSELGLQKHVHFLGWRRDVLSIMRISDVILLPSLSEGLPRSLLEGMALGKPIVATAVGGIPELVRDGVDGFLVKPGDVHGIVCALERLTNPALRALMGRKAQHRVRERFSLSVQAREFFRAIEALP